MFLYLSTFSLVTAHGMSVIQPTVAPNLASGAGWAHVDFRNKTNAAQNATTGRCLVGSPVAASGALPAGVQLLLNTATGLDTVIPTAALNAINTQLGTSIPAGTLWRAGFHQLFLNLGNGKWGTIFSDAVANFGPAGTFTF